tara:strand:+ start:36008 stop:36931 length:924 start_codon:yes stop_codon:yes gene_type:complete
MYTSIKQEFKNIAAVLTLIFLYSYSIPTLAQIHMVKKDLLEQLPFSSNDTSKNFWSDTELFLQDDNNIYEQKKPAAALRRSFLFPGWGEYYSNTLDWTRGQWHMALDVSLILSYVGIRYRVSFLEDELVTFAQSNAGIDLTSRDREMFLAVSNHDNLALYNDYQLRTRNWNKRLKLIPENEWNWTSNSSRSQFNNMRERVDKNKNQLPALITLMVINRVISGIHAFGLIRDSNNNRLQAHLGLGSVGSYVIVPHILETNIGHVGDMKLWGYSKALFGSQSFYLDRRHINHIQQLQVSFYTLNLRINL